jgi:REP element-mobilizing transposase RayT
MQCKILTAWVNAANWIVGRYVIMPDHIHFFCAPSKYPASDFHKWMKFWKRLSTQMMSEQSGGRLSSAVAGRVSSRAAKLWQDGCWDTQMRTSAQYEEKWQYIRNNPVRKGLVENADDWPYQGVMNEFVWHD